MRTLIVAAGLAFGICCATSPVMAQTRVGGSSGGSSSSGSGALGSSGGYSNRNVRGGGSLGGNGQTASVSNGLLSQQGLEFGGGGVDRTQESGFFGASQNASGGLFGGQSNRSGGGGLNAGGMLQGLSNLFGGGRQGQGGRGGQNGGNSQNQRRMTYRPQRSVAFDVPAVASEAQAANVVQTYRQSAARTRGVKLASGANINAQSQGGTLVLSGRVSSAHDKALAERIALLEPGVSKVRNDLVVESNAQSNPNSTNRN